MRDECGISKGPASSAAALCGRLQARSSWPQQEAYPGGNSFRQIRTRESATTKRVPAAASSYKQAHTGQCSKRRRMEKSLTSSITAANPGYCQFRGISHTHAIPKPPQRSRPQPHPHDPAAPFFICFSSMRRARVSGVSRIHRSNSSRSRRRRAVHARL